jgi:hypothetical protein
MTGANGRCPLPTASPLPQIAALIAEHQLLKRIYRQRSTEEETAVIEEAIAAVDVFADIPVLMAKALADGISGEFAYQIGLAGYNPACTTRKSPIRSSRRSGSYCDLSRRTMLPRPLRRSSRN